MEGLTFSFDIMEADNLHLLKEFYLKESEQEISELKNDNTSQLYQSNYNSNLKNSRTYTENFPLPQITEYDNPAPGYIFISSTNENVDARYIAIYDNYGTSVFYRNLPLGVRDFRRTVNDVLLYSQQSNNNPAENAYFITDNRFITFDTTRLGGIWYVDTHDALYFADSSYLLMAYDPQPYAMDTIVTGGIRMLR